MVALTAVDLVLLAFEWLETEGGVACPQCFGTESHHPGCIMDLALAERGFATKDQRDGARKSIA
jgi:hypothetical protein